MAYRSDIDALAARDEVLARELADKQREHAEVQQLLTEARAAQAAEARAQDVLVGRRTLRGIALVTGAVIVAGAAAGTVLYRRHASPVAGMSPTALVERQATFAAAGQTAYELALAAKGLTPIALEPRPLGGVGGFATREELVAALGATGPIEPWQPFIYTRDAQARTAIASEEYRVAEGAPPSEFVSDGHGGIWRAKRVIVPTTTTAVTVDDCEGGASRTPQENAESIDRRVWLLPLASGFRGDLEVEVKAPTLRVTYARGGCPPAP